MSCFRPERSFICWNQEENQHTKYFTRRLIFPLFRHTFWAHATGTEDLIFKVWVEPQDLDNGFDEAFMRNFSGYLNDCHKQGLAPSVFQILLFLYEADIVLTPPFWLPLAFLMGLHHVMAYWVGAALLG